MRRSLGMWGVLGAVALFPSAASAVRFHAADGIRVASAHRLDARLIALAVRTSALAAPADVRVLLPHGYASSPHSRYPVLYLLDDNDPGGFYRITTESVAGGSFHLQQALGSGRLRVRVPLGPSNSVRQYVPGNTTALFETRVRIARDR